MKSTQYTEKVMDHFRNPRNVGVIENPDGYGKVGNPVCGDLMEMFLRIEKNEEGKDIIEDIKFRTFGCGSAVATSSMVTEMAMGMMLDEAYKITRNDVANELDGLPPIKMHCSNLAADALKAAIDNYRKGTDPEVESQASCKPINLDIILGVDEFLEKGVYKEIPNLEELRDKRTLIVDTGRDSLESAIQLIDFNGRVILITNKDGIPGSGDLKKQLKFSDVKILRQSKLIEVQGTNDVEKVIIHDIDENENYELFVDAVILV